MTSYSRLMLATEIERAVQSNDNERANRLRALMQRLERGNNV